MCFLSKIENKIGLTNFIAFFPMLYQFVALLALKLNLYDRLAEISRFSRVMWNKKLKETSQHTLTVR